ncbi:MAG: Rieske 2Fe-2S domain-containing protein [Planctomycetes bacterium]|nr:Rieske 2Fe-2S domain-containing protein [Planctomycetota bacterium]
MATKDLIVKVWIEEGCIVCDACETSAPTVFHITEDSCIIRPEAMEAEFTKPITDNIVEAAEECPVDVIKYETVPGEVPDEAPVAAEPAAAPAAEAATTAPAIPDAPPAAAPAEPKPAAAKHAPEKAPVAAMAGDVDQAMKSLLEAATARGGRAGMERSADAGGAAAKRWANKSLDELPPDGRQARITDAAKPDPSSKKEPTRRTVLTASSVALGVGWATFGGATFIGFGPALARFMIPNVSEDPDPKVRVGELAKYFDMAPGDVNEDYKPKGIWMIRLEDRIAALSIICTHLGCIPNWLPNDHKFKCPCHGSGYHQNGVNFEGPTPRPLERFSIRLEDGIVIVDKSRTFHEEWGQWGHSDSFLLV